MAPGLSQLEQLFNSGRFPYVAVTRATGFGTVHSRSRKFLKTSNAFPQHRDTVQLLAHGRVMRWPKKGGETAARARLVGNMLFVHGARPNMGPMNKDLGGQRCAVLFEK